MSNDNIRAVRITYTNYRGETAVRLIEPDHVWFGSTEWHPEPQWLLRARDLDKGSAVRDFAMRDIADWAAGST